MTVPAENFPVLRRLKGSLQRFRAYRAVRFCWHFARDPIFRADHVLLCRKPQNLFQHRSITASDRYPVIFDFVRNRLADVERPRLLSFGCATGEEVFSLRKYFPHASIKGIDINPANIARCRAAQRLAGNAPGLSFECGSSTANEARESYDAVFCMAVFTRWQLKDDRGIASSAPHLFFRDFERTISELAACIAPGGFFVLRHSAFRLGDTKVAREFECVLTLPPPLTFSPRFGPDNLRLPDDAPEQVVFRRLPQPRGLE